MEIAIDKISGSTKKFENELQRINVIASNSVVIINSLVESSLMFYL